MSTKSTITLLFLVFILMNLFMWLSEKTGATAFLGLAALLSLVSFGLMLYAFSRERTLGDKSESVPPKVAVFIFVAVAVWVGFICFRSFTH